MNNYKNRKCWQATSQVSIRKGIVIEQKLTDTGWLLVHIKWQDNTFSWEKVNSVSFNFKQIEG